MQIVAPALRLERTSEGTSIMHTLNQTAARLEAGEPSLALIDQCLDRIKSSGGEGDRAFLKVYGDRARGEADRRDAGQRDQRAAPVAGGQRAKPI